MMPGVVISDRQRLRQGARDSGAHLDVPPGKGPESTVSQEAMTQRAHEIEAALGGPRQAPGRSGQDAAHLRAATLPPVGPGQSHNAAGAGERQQTGAQPGTQRGTGNEGRHT
jgi:hypothetical protein